jgi:hypothetical protein
VVPENAMIFIDGESYFMENSGEFQFKIAKRISDVVFLEGNAVSEEYQLKVVAVPTIANFEMQLNYPLYLNRKSEVVNGTVMQ